MGQTVADKFRYERQMVVLHQDDGIVGCRFLNDGSCKPLVNRLVETPIGRAEHSSASLLCWAGLERLERIKRAGHLPTLSQNVTAGRIRAAEALLRAAHDNAVRNGPTDMSYDAALVHLPILGYPDHQLCEMTTLQIIQHLAFPTDDHKTGFFFRYVRQDDYGKPEAAFVICSFWIVQALARLGRIAEARIILDHVLSSANHLGLFAEHFIPSARTQCGNFPQAYSHIGLINAAFAVSPPWNEIL